MPISIAMVPLNPKAKLSSAAIKADMVQKKWRGLPQPESLEAEKGQVAFRVGDSDVIIAVMRAPIPWSDLEGPCRTSWLWKDAEADLKGHAGHLIVTVTSQNEPIKRKVMRLEYSSGKKSWFGR
jgi:hypothetical protein